MAAMHHNLHQASVRRWAAAHNPALLVAWEAAGSPRPVQRTTLRSAEAVPDREPTTSTPAPTPKPRARKAPPADTLTARLARLERAARADRIPDMLADPTLNVDMAVRVAGDLGRLGVEHGELMSTMREVERRERRLAEDAALCNHDPRAAAERRLARRAARLGVSIDAIRAVEGSK